ncbi:MAG: (Fe-S)-binding protein [Desulfohalobiaceae bacterium]
MQLSQTQINYCMECGVCTGSCPVSYTLETFSPRQIIKNTLIKKQDLTCQRELWACLTCARCSERCPVHIDFPEFIRHYRDQADECQNQPLPSHHGVFQTISELQTALPAQNRTAWAEAAGRVQKEQGQIYLFTGCMPYFDVFFRYLDLECLQTAKSGLALLNTLGIEPVLSNQECCCGHDALWSGRQGTFQTLANRNLQAIQATGAQKVLFLCPEGYLTFKKYYPEVLGELPFEVQYLSEFLVQELPQAEIGFISSTNGLLTYQDPCRLGRWCGEYEHPRQLIQMVPNTNLVEMDKNRENAQCCGTTAWMECSSCSRQMQGQRLQEAQDTGAATLLTSCPKCQIHLQCAQSDQQKQLKIQDIFTYLHEHLS